MNSYFDKSFTQQEPLPEAALESAMNVLRHGRLHRYNVTENEDSETSLLEKEFADYMGVKYCLSVASGGYALACALRAVGVEPNDPVLTNAFTLAPVPGAIASLGAKPVLVEITRDLLIDFDDLNKKIDESNSRILLISHMRGHICDMDELVSLCDKRKVLLIEDCAHTMGGTWDGTNSGLHGLVSCYSTQTYKHLNSGEGGLLVSNDPDLMSRAIILSGSYMLYDRHIARPETSDFGESKYYSPNCSGRMDNLRAAILRPQLRELSIKCEEWNKRYGVIENILGKSNRIGLIQRPSKEGYVGSSIQFYLDDISGQGITKFVNKCRKRGVELKWFGDEEPHGYTSRFDSWKYIAPQDCPNTKTILSTLLDMRIPLSFTLVDCERIASIIVEETGELD
ncbi:MAG: aminotransferase class I/II-fold pyridoxal phosphate-dependent enzyme [Paracoccaceae bacterium]|nr:aminotransferase class I/II-fold pyridoxal phosphate-dependent enzyme [Paracoccaceae bacterium]MDE2673844.1 aminotransferase class I/II-fold pyridoxal phosphate-dependent enzyme [Paracoccaceae bacterium]